MAVGRQFERVEIDGLEKLVERELWFFGSVSEAEGKESKNKDEQLFWGHGLKQRYIASRQSL